MEEKKNLLTFTGLKKLEEELHDLKVFKRKEVAGKIKEAREQGDLSENAEYDAAKDEQRDIEARIEEIEKILKNVEVVDEDEVDLDKISVGCRVKVYDIEFDEEMEFSLVGSSEANSLKGKISNESPVGKALIGAKVGDVVEVETQAGLIQYKVLEIQRSNYDCFSEKRGDRVSRYLRREYFGRTEECSGTGHQSAPEGAPGEACAAAGGRKGSVPDHKIRCNTSQHRDQGSV